MNRTATILLVVLASAQAHASDQVPGTAQAKPVLLRGADLYTVSHGVQSATDILFEKGKIAKIGAKLEAPKDAEVVDVTGKRIYPGFIAPATTLGLIEIGAVRATNDTAEVGGITPEAAAHIAYNPDSELLPTIRNHGITTAQVMPSGSLLRGRPLVTYLDGWTKEDAAVRLTYGMAVTWPVLPRRNPFDEGGGRRRSREDLEKERKENLTRLANAFDDARAYLANRKAESPVEIDVRHEAMRGVIEGKEPVFVEVETYAGIREAMAFAEKEKVQLVVVGAADAWRLAHELAEANVAVILGGALGLPRREDDPYDAAFHAPAVLHEAGVKFCIGDTGESWQVRNLGLHAAQAVAFGLPADAALRAITLSAAEILGVDSKLGSLDTGKAATLFVSDGDPLDSLTQHISDVWIDGRHVDLDDRHKELYRKYKQKPAQTASFALPKETSGR
jgi:imidazolonepropionase-like amidohydrolase